MSEPDNLCGRVATSLIEDMDTEIKANVATEQEWDTWAKLCQKINWRQVARGAILTVVANLREQAHD